MHLYFKLTLPLTKMNLVQLCHDSITATVNIKYTRFLNIFWLYFHELSNSDMSWFPHAKSSLDLFYCEKKKCLLVFSVQATQCIKTIHLVFSNCKDITCGFLVTLPLLLHFLSSSLLNSGQTFGFLRRLQFFDNLLSTHCNLKQNSNNASTNEQFVTSHICALPFLKTRPFHAHMGI